MEDLIENFSKHMNKLISPELGTKIRNLSKATISYATDEDYSRMESNIQLLIESYLSNLKEKDFKDIAHNIYNSFVEEDDKNLIKAINFYKRTYEYYQEMNLRKKLFRWRKTALKLKMISDFVQKEKMARKNQNYLKKNTDNKNNKKINSERYNDNEDYYNNLDNININMNGKDRKNTIDLNNKEFGNVEDFIKKKNNNNKQIYKFNYINKGIDNDNKKNDEYEEEFMEELDMNKLYSKNQYNNKFENQIYGD